MVQKSYQATIMAGYYLKTYKIWKFEKQIEKQIELWNPKTVDCVKPPDCL